MHILVTNDDGITAPGLLALTKEMRRIGDVSVLAPDHNWSASGHVKTMHRPLRVKEAILADGSSAWTSDGAPSDCVALGLLGFIPGKIDLVVSGINPNANIGHDVTYSGTVTAAMEAAIGGVAGIAFSLHSPDDFQGTLDFSPAARIAYRIVTAIIANHKMSNLLLNVNIPYLPDEQIKASRLPGRD
jgi:5'-nucleotidase